MKLHRFIGPFDLSQREIELTNPENIKQIKGVLRLGVGDHIILSDGKENQAEFLISEILREKIVCEKIQDLTSNEPAHKVNLFLAILKKENFEVAVQKAVECGVNNIIPIITERTVKTGLNIPRLEKIILEASEQCERSSVPNLQEIMNFENALAYGYASIEKIIFHPDTTDYNAKILAKSVSIFIGPEGGFSDKELELARSSGYRVVSLGNLILRGETAATIATYRAVQGI